MYIELIQRCKQLFLTQTDTVDDHFYQMPSFLQSIASVLLYLDTVSGIIKLSTILFNLSSSSNLVELYALSTCPVMIKVTF